MSDFWKDSDFARDYQYNYSKNLYGSGNRPTIIVQYGDDGQFVTATTTSLIHYYTKSQTYSADQIDEMIGAIAGMHFEVVAELPTRSISTTTIYLVPSTNPTSKNVKDEYINLDGTTSGWELIGSTSIDFSDYVTVERLNTILSEYVTGSELRSALSGKVDKVTGKGLSTNDYTNAEKSKLADLKNRRTIKDKNGYSVLDRDNVQFTGNVQVVDDASNNKTIVNIQGGGGSGDTVGWNQIQQSGTKIAEISINGSSQNVYAPNGGGGGGSEVSYDPTLTSGTKTGEITIDGVTTNMYAPNPTNVSVSQTLQSGTEIGEISVNGQTTTLYAPNGGSGSSTFAGLSDVSLNNLQDGQIPKYNSITHKWENADESGGGSGGHTIYNNSGTAMTQRAGLQFEGNISVTDDSANNRTIVEVLGGGGTPISLVPTMNSNSQDGYTARASSEWSSDYQAYMAFDGTTVHAWSPQNITAYHWVEIEMPSAKRATKFTITTREGSYYATSVVVQGSNDGVNYDDLGSVSGMTTGSSATVFNMSTTTYSIYRFVVDNYGLSEIYIEGIEGGGGSEDVELTIAEYIALPDTKLSDDKNYFITDLNNDNVLGYPPLIYSDEEREIGVWRDGKPLYQKTLVINELNLDVNGTAIDITSLGVDVCCPVYEGSYYIVSGVKRGFARLEYQQPNDVYLFPAFNRTGTTCFVTLQYTKTTDTPGSGIWNGQGCYTHHYSTSEKVIGTWYNGKPIYEKTYELSSALLVEYTSWTNTTIDSSNIQTVIDAKGYNDDGTFYGTVMADPTRNSHTLLGLQTTRNGSQASVKVLTIQYTKITD